MQKIIVLLFFLLSSIPALAADDCPFGLTNDPAPGNCGLYVDRNGNYLCDRSEKDASTSSASAGKQALSEDELKAMSVTEVAEYFGISAQAYASELSAYLKTRLDPAAKLQTLHDENGLCAGVAASIAGALKDGGQAVGEAIKEAESHDLISGQELKTKTVSQVAVIYGINVTSFTESLSEEIGGQVSSGDSFQALHDSAGLSPSRVKEIASSLASQGQKDVDISETSASAAAGESAGNTEDQDGGKSAPYKFFYILASILAAYALTSFLAARKKITILTHRRIWNMVLLLSFLVSAIFGIMLVLAINYGWFIPVYAFILYWHVEAGTAMAIVTIFHIAWHWPYYACMFKRRKNSEDNNCGEQ